MLIAVITVFSGLTNEQGKRVNSAKCIHQFALLACLFKQKNIGLQAQL